MPTTTTAAFKEWASVTEALARGEQILILRKGGIQEAGRKFQVLHESFFLFPTYEHQKLEDLNSRGQQLLTEIKQKPQLTDSSKVTIEYFCEIQENFWLDNFDKLLKTLPFHELKI